MAFCSKCGVKLEKEAKFCRECGNEIVTTKKTAKKDEKVEEIKNSIDEIMDTKDSTDKFTKKDAKENMGFALISYLGVLALIPYFLGKSSKFVQYHAKQGMNLLIVWAGYIIAYNLLALIKVTKRVTYFGYTYASYKITPWWIKVPMSVVGVGIFALAIIGIVYVCQGKAKELPIVGKIKIVK